MKVALYPRVSTQEQAANGHSIDEQIERMKKYCGAMGWDVYKVYTDAGFSGSNTDRPALQNMIADIRLHKIDRVLVYKLDRLSRSQKDTLELIEDEFLAHGVDFVSMSENFDTATPFGRAMIGILAVFAQLEREQIKERMMMGKQARAKAGKFHGSGILPIGYDYENDMLVKNEWEAVQVAEAFKLAAQNLSPNEIAKILTAHGYYHHCGEWSGRSVRRVLRNKTYCGYIRDKENWHKGNHEPIVDETLYNAVQTVLAKRAEQHLQYNRRAGKVTSILGGLLYCGQCGAKYSKTTSKQPRKSGGFYIYENFYCNSKERKKRAVCHDPNCQNRGWKVEELTDIVLGEIKKLHLDPVEVPVHADNNAAIDAEIAKIDKQQARLIELYAIGSIPIDKVSAKSQELNDRKTRLIAERALKKKKPTKAELLQSVGSFSEILDNGSFDDVRNIVTTLIEKIVLDGDNIEIHWNFV
ncbi:MAG: recombinase family protein [Clostridia bacterium]|nr:recombinase family protein [Clostridia bacterium]